MDLQLGLGISSSSSSSSTNEFNHYYSNNVYDGIQNQPQMGGGGGAFSYSCNLDVDTDNRFLDQTFDEMNSNRSVPPTLSLLMWDQNHQHHHHTDTTNSLSLEYNKDGNGDVGWPPISARRKRMYNQNRGEENGGGGDNGIGKRSERNTLFVKVKMEGEGIGRKVDLSLHHSLQSLLQTLVVMFGKCEESVQSYKLVYQDEVGFWELAEEDSWGTLIQTACRLKLMRNNY